MNIHNVNMSYMAFVVCIQKLMENTLFLVGILTMSAVAGLMILFRIIIKTGGTPQTLVSSSGAPGNAGYLKDRDFNWCIARRDKVPNPDIHTLGTHSKPFRTCEININAMNQIRGNVKVNFPLQVGLTPSGEMQPVLVTPASGIFWPKLVDIASDCHDQNIKLSRWHSKDTLILQATRDIPAGQSLQLWFSEDLMMSELGIPPYLSPFNIKGGNSYVCHECHEQFERPNFLKLHLALHCDRLSSDTLWNRLKTTSIAPPLLLNHHPPYLMTLSPSPSSSGSPCPSLFSISTAVASAASLHLESLSPPLLHHLHHHRHHSHSQALPHNLKHLQMPNLNLNNNEGTRRAPTISSSPTSSSSPSSPIIGVEAPVEVASAPVDADVPATPPPPDSNGRNSLVVQEQHHHHARLEAIVSNMGKAKNGHVCLYCGKLYSRKYGLKIHIRTHTGYKPLRCKICHRPFGDPSNLNKHVRLHSDGTTPYRCELCSKVLVRRRDLDRHMRARHHHHNGSSTHGTLQRSNGNGNGNLARQGCSTSSRSNGSSTVTSTMVSGSSL